MSSPKDTSKTDNTSPPEFIPPVPTTGVVMWAPDPNGPWYTAMVTGIGHSAIDCSVVEPYSRQLRPRDGVRHKDDPQFWRLPSYEEGVWDFTESDKLVRKLSEELLGKTPGGGDATEGK